MDSEVTRNKHMQRGIGLQINFFIFLFFKKNIESLAGVIKTYSFSHQNQSLPGHKFLLIEMGFDTEYFVYVEK